MVFDFILDFLFPKKCVGCGKEGTWFCPACLSKISFCEVPFVRLGGFSLEGLIAVAYFQDPLKEAIHALKYDGVRELSKPLSELLIKHLKDERLQFIKGSILIPMPLHKKRELQRGFNQAVLLAEEIGKKLNLKILENVLVKAKNTAPQMELKKEERRKNIKGAFAFVGDKKTVKGKIILLVDDVATTGSTLTECAKVLKRAGAKAIWGLVLAKD